MEDILFHNKFIVTPYIEDLINRSLVYLKSGFPVHYRGSAGTGKTALALHIARKMNRPVMVMFGNEELERSNLIGNSFGLKRKVIYDNFISSVVKKEEEIEDKWIDGRILHACKNGYVLVYDEFTRSRPETNNVFLSILEEEVIEIASNKSGNEYIKIHPEFKVIFTSNPDEYAGIYKLQDALKDRMITLSIGYPDRETEIKIVKAQTQVLSTTAEIIVDIIRRFRDLKYSDYNPTVRSGIMIGKSIKTSKLENRIEGELFKQICRDIILSEKSYSKITENEKNKAVVVLDKIIDHVLSMYNRT